MRASAPEVVHLWSYEGPNICGPQPGVSLCLRCEHDQSRYLREIFQAAAQHVGLLYAYLDITTSRSDDGYCLVRLSFTTPLPAVGAAILSHLLDRLQAEANGDTDWDALTPLVDLQQRHRRESLNRAMLQLVAEAHARHIPFLRHPDRSCTFGYGHRSWRCSETDIIPEHQSHPPWDRLGTIPIYAITGESARADMVQQVAEFVRHAGHIPAVLDDATYDQCRTLLADRTTQAIVVGLRTADILRRGVAFRSCTWSIITDSDGECPAEATTPTDWFHALGLPMLLTSSPALLNTDDRFVPYLAEYAPHGIRPLRDLPLIAADW